MKTILKRFIALTLAVILISAPSIAMAASSPVLVLDMQGVKVFEYQPDPYFVSGGSTTTLNDTAHSDGRWYVPAGNNFVFNISFDESCYYKVYIHKAGYGFIELTDIMDAQFPQFIVDPIDQDANYQIFVIAVSDVEITTYAGFVY